MLLYLICASTCMKSTISFHKVLSFDVLCKVTFTISVNPFLYSVRHLVSPKTMLPNIEVFKKNTIMVPYTGAEIVFGCEKKNENK